MNLEKLLQLIGDEVGIEVYIGDNKIWSNNYELYSPYILIDELYTDVIEVRGSENRIIITLGGPMGK